MTLMLRMVERALTHQNMPIEVYTNNARQRPAIADREDQAPVEFELAARVMSLKALLELYTSRTPEKEVLDALQRLEALGPFSIEILQTTKVEKAVSGLMKRTQSAAVRAFTRASLSEWKDLARRNARWGPTAAPPAPLQADPEVCAQIAAQCLTAQAEPAESSLAERSLDEEALLKAAEQDPEVQALLAAGDMSDSDSACEKEEAQLKAEPVVEVKAAARPAPKSETCVRDFLRACAKPSWPESPSPPELPVKSAAAKRKATPKRKGIPELALVTRGQETAAAAAHSPTSMPATDVPVASVAKAINCTPTALQHESPTTDAPPAKAKKMWHDRNAKTEGWLDTDTPPAKVAKKSKSPNRVTPKSADSKSKGLLDTALPIKASGPKRKAAMPLMNASPAPAQAAPAVLQQHMVGPKRKAAVPLMNASPVPDAGRLSSPQSGGKSPQTAIVPYVRRRLVGKQPRVMSLAIEVYSGKRLRGKQPAPVVSERKTISVRGHYDALGVLRSAKAAEIHAAYRRRALATHPDKGGDPQDFRRVKLAFEELVDGARRAAYDRNLVLFGRRDGMTSETTGLSSQKAQAVTQETSADRQYYGAARVAQFSLLANSRTTWSGALAKMQDGVLANLQDILKGSKSPQADSGLGAGGGAHGNLQGWQGPTCITQHPTNGYKVTVSWAELSVCTSFTKSLTQIIDWQIALFSMQSAAQLRMKRGGRSDSKDPLTENELLQVLEREPGLELTFTIKVTDGGKKGKTLSVGGVTDLQLAMDFRQKLLAAARGKNPVAALKALKRNADEEATKQTKHRRICSQRLLTAVSQELQKRRAGPPGTSDQSSKALVLHQACRQENAKTPTLGAKGTTCARQTKTSTCKVSRKRKAPVEAPVRRKRV